MCRVHKVKCRDSRTQRPFARPKVLKMHDDEDDRNSWHPKIPEAVTKMANPRLKDHVEKTVRPPSEGGSKPKAEMLHHGKRRTSALGAIPQARSHHLSATTLDRADLRLNNTARV